MSSYFKYCIAGVISFSILAIGIIVLSKYESIAIKISSPSVAIDDAYIINFADDRVLMGASHNVFIGKVIGQVNNQEESQIPETQFSVEVVSNIKGDLNGLVTVNEQGGYDKNGVFYYIEDGAPLLQSGATYLLATRVSSLHPWYILNSFPSASELISSNSSLTDVQLRTLAANNLRVKQLQAAYPNEILLDSDIKTNNTLNSYKSLSVTTSSDIETQ